MVSERPTRLAERFRAYQVLMAFAFGAAPREAALFLFSGAVMSLHTPVAAFGAKLLVDAALARDVSAALGSAALLAVAAGIGQVNTLYYLDFLFAVAEKSGAAVNRRLMTLMGGVPGLAHHELPAYLKELDLLREERGALAWMTNSTAGLVRVAVQVTATVALFSQLHLALLLLPLFGFGSFWAGRRARELQQAAAEAGVEAERRRKHLFQLATAADAGKELRVFGLTGELIARHHRAAAEVDRLRDRAEWQGALLNGLGALLFAVGYIGAIGLVVLQALQGQATPGDVVLTVGLAAGLNGVVFTAVAYGTGFLHVLRVARRLLWLEDYAAEALRGSAPVVRLAPAEPVNGAASDSDAAALPERLQGGIELEGVTFRYPADGVDGAEDSGARPILDGVSLQLPAGRVVALVGENGAGKTTLVKLLLGFYAPDAGRILVDGVDVRTVAAEAWRERTSAAFQDFARFELLARETVGVGDLPRMRETAAVMAGLERAGASDVPAALPQGLETQLGKAWEGGAELSGGQWQKLALGRAMMRSTPLLAVFDEPTSALDPQTEHALFERISAAARAAREVGGGGTVTLLVSHRFSTVRMADLIVVLSDGRIKEQGSHEALMAQGGLYAELYRLQSRAYR